MRIRGRSGIAVFLCVSSLLLLSVSPVIDVPEEVSAQTSDGPAPAGDEDEWHSFHKDLANSGAANCDGPMNDNTAWINQFPGRSSGSISYGDRVIFRPAGFFGVQAINPFTGDIMWNVSHDAGQVATIPVYYEGKVYFGTNWGDGTYYAVNASDGSILWTQTIGDEYTAGTVIVDGIVYVPLVYDQIVAMDALTGEIIWDREVQSSLHATPAYESGILYTGHYRMQAVNASTGDIIWTGPLSRVSSSVLLVGDTVCGHGHGYVMCLNKTDGVEVWLTDVGTTDAWSAIESTPAVLGDRLFVGTQDGWLYALDRNDGSILWELTNGNLSGSSFLASPVTALNDVVYFMNDDLYAVDPLSGDIIWSVTGFCPGITRSSPALVDGVLYAHCSQERRIWAFGDAAPAPPVMLDAQLAGPVLEDVVVTWQRSLDDGGGADDVNYYSVYVSNSFEGPYMNTDLIVATGLETYEWTCSGCGEGDPGDHFFYVKAGDSRTYVASPNKVGKFTRPLLPGWNLVSVPLVQSDASIETVLQTVEYDKAWSYDSPSGEWQWQMTFKTYRRGLWNINHTMGLWVNATEDCNLTVAGIVPAQTTIYLREGWNLLSFPSFNSSYTVADLKAELPVERVEGFDPTAPPHFLQVLQDSDMLLAGEGYWVRVSADVTWVVSNG